MGKEIFSMTYIRRWKKAEKMFDYTPKGVIFISALGKVNLNP